MLSKDVACIQPQHLSAMRIQTLSTNIEDKTVIESTRVGYVILLCVSIFLSFMAVIIPHACFLAVMTETSNTPLALLLSLVILTPILLSILNCYQISTASFGMCRLCIPVVSISSTLFFFTHLI